MFVWLSDAGRLRLRPSHRCQPETHCQRCRAQPAAQYEVHRARAIKRRQRHSIAQLLTIGDVRTCPEARTPTIWPRAGSMSPVPPPPRCARPEHRRPHGVTAPPGTSERRESIPPPRLHPIHATSRFVSLESGRAIERCRLFSRPAGRTSRRCGREQGEHLPVRVRSACASWSKAFKPGPGPMVPTGNFACHGGLAAHLAAHLRSGLTRIQSSADALDSIAARMLRSAQQPCIPAGRRLPAPVRGLQLRGRRSSGAAVGPIGYAKYCWSDQYFGDRCIGSGGDGRALEPKNARPTRRCI